MKMTLIPLAMLLPIMYTSYSMENLKKKHECSVKCVNICMEVQKNHKMVLIGLQEKLQLRQNLGNAAGKPCTHIKSEGLESLFAEPETDVSQITQKTPVKNYNSSSSSQAMKTTQYTDIDTLLNELEKDLPNPIVSKKINLIDHIKELTILVRRAGSQTLSLLKPESTETDINNLDATCRQLEEKNNILPDLIRTATLAEKNNPEFLRLFGLVTQAVESAKRLEQKEPLVNFQDDFTHPFNGYKNEIQLLQRLLNSK